MDEDLRLQVRENTRRITELDESNAVAHQRIEGKLDHVITLVDRMQWMAKGAKYALGFLFAVFIWFVHEWETVKRFFK